MAVSNTNGAQASRIYNDAFMNGLFVIRWARHFWRCCYLIRAFSLRRDVAGSDVRPLHDARLRWIFFKNHAVDVTRAACDYIPMRSALSGQSGKLCETSRCCRLSFVCVCARVRVSLFVSLFLAMIKGSVSKLIYERWSGCDVFIYLLLTLFCTRRKVHLTMAFKC